MSFAVQLCTYSLLWLYVYVFCAAHQFITFLKVAYLGTNTPFVLTLQGLNVSSRNQYSS